MASGASIPPNEPVAIAKIVLQDVPDDPGLAKTLGECADGIGAPISGLEVILVAVRKPHGDALLKEVQRRLYGRNRPRQVGGTS
jgi:hypothetical protein